MAKLQTYPGKGKDAGKTFFRLQPYLPNGRRVTIRLGPGQKRAEKAVKAIGDLIECQREEVDLNASTKAWIEKADKKLLESLVGFGLIDPERIKDPEVWTLERLISDYVKLRGAGKSKSTLQVWERSRNNLFQKFGKDCDIRKLTKRDGREFYRWLLQDQEPTYSENTAKQRLRYARSFFEQAVEDQLIELNPFKARELPVTQSAAEKEYVSRETIEQVIRQTANPEWKLLFALTRSIPIRVPSEIKELTWNDIDWDKNQILIHSPKTRSIGKHARLAPLFADLKPFLNQLWDNGDETYVFPAIRLNTNPATYAKTLLDKANVKHWSNFFNSLRASAETDLMDAYGLRRACQWGGNSAATAMKNYALIRNEDFIDAGEKVDAKSDAILATDAKCAAESASTSEHDDSSNPTKNASGQNTLGTECVEVGDTGLEPVTPCL